MLSQAAIKEYVEIRAFLPLPSIFDSTPDVVRNLLYSALQVKALQNLYMEARGRSTKSLSQNVLDTLQVTVDVSVQDLALIPQTGPLLLVANHPFGFLDGLILDAVLLQVRPNVKILTNDVLCHLRELHERFIPVRVLGAQAPSDHVKSVRQVVHYLREGNGVAVFPAGTVSHWSSEQRRITDSSWSTLAVRCAKSVYAPIVPVFFVGKNSVLFQTAGLLHPGLRTARLPGELLNKRGRKVEVRIGTPILPAELSHDRHRATAYVRARTYMLGHRTPARQQVHTYSKRRSSSHPSFIRRDAGLEVTTGIRREIEELDKNGQKIVENDTYAVYAEQGRRIPFLLGELGRLREITYRLVGEGTGHAINLDEWDSEYTHLVLWHKSNSSIAGSYRLAWTTDVFARTTIKGLYTSALFRYSSEFFNRLGPAVELGRSFICPEYQKEYAPLLLLWQAIARCIARRPESHVLFGAVSISASYSEVSRELMVHFLRERCFRDDLAPFVIPKQPFRRRFLRKEEARIMTESSGKIDDLPIGDIDRVDGVPILLRQYLRLGGKVAGFNTDPKFSNVLDGLLIVDLCDTEPKLLAKYMGVERSHEFLRSARLCGLAQREG
ncbi:MAG TPA: lysophospholipid acyltransferase family protein [Bryobacteraceae bacterium]